MNKNALEEEKNSKVINRIKKIKNENTNEIYKLKGILNMDWKDEKAYYLLIKDMDNHKVKAQLAWEFLRRNLEYYNILENVATTLVVLKTAIERNSNKYAKDSTLQKICMEKIELLKRLNEFGLTNPLFAPFIDRDEPPKFYCYNWSNTEWDPYVPDHDDENENPSNDDAPVKKKYPNLYKALYELSVIDKDQLKLLHRYKKDHPFIVMADFSIVHDISSQIHRIQEIIKTKKSENKINHGLNIDIYIRYLRMIDAVFEIDSEDWKSETFKIKTTLCANMGERTFYSNMEQAIALSQDRHYLKLVRLEYLLNLN